ncbi:hypothetical protein NUW54_g4706 [Trametes sanguinea]|uniref:Uncharacterized protein n=1 Tax=Trametes sanguinea TaxID=158606 RepID=A0ACC1PX67_9APHY|nr:hypothetical protein NUW54_g4706 [Trametes sanguinea]
MSARVQRTTTCVIAPPSGCAVVSSVRRDVHIGSASANAQEEQSAGERRSNEGDGTRTAHIAHLRRRLPRDRRRRDLLPVPALRALAPLRARDRRRPVLRVPRRRLHEQVGHRLPPLIPSDPCCTEAVSPDCGCCAWGASIRATLEVCRISRNMRKNGTRIDSATLQISPAANFRAVGAGTYSPGAGLYPQCEQGEAMRVRPQYAMTPHTTPKRFFPLPGFYGVMEMDPVAMVQDLKDQEAERLARAMQTKKYLVYLYNPIELPWPDRPWYGYYVYPIGPFLRSENAEKAITSDMCIPIAPNKEHPARRSPLATVPPFPFTNCYHWVDALTRVRIRAGQEFDETRAVQLPNVAQVQMQDMFEEDMDRAYDVLEERQQSGGPPAAQSIASDTVGPEGGSQPIHNCGITPPATSGRQSLGRSGTRSNSEGSSCSGSRRPSFSASVDSMDVFAALDPFGFSGDEDVLLAPLVDFCFDLTDHLCQEEIPSPVEFWNERDQILSIMKEARERASQSLLSSSGLREPIDPTLDPAAKYVQGIKDTMLPSAVMHASLPNGDAKPCGEGSARRKQATCWPYPAPSSICTTHGTRPAPTAYFPAPQRYSPTSFACSDYSIYPVLAMKPLLYRRTCSSALASAIHRLLALLRQIMPALQYSRMHIHSIQ